MESVKPLIAFSSSPLFNKLLRHCRPLDSSLGVDVFWHSLITAEGFYSFFGTRPDITEFYYYNDLYKANPFLRNPANYYDTAVLPLSLSNPEFQFSQDSTNRNFSLKQILLILKKEGNSCHCFGFTTSKNKADVGALYLNEPSVFHKFSGYFLKEWHQYTETIEPYKINIAKLIGPKFYSQDPGLLPRLPFQKREKFLREIGQLKEIPELSNILSTREIECLNLYSKGFTAFQTAQTLALSVRTIEFYFENIKNKLGASSKKELLTFVV